MKSVKTELFLYLFLDLILLNNAFLFAEWLQTDDLLKDYERSIFLLNTNLAWVIAYFVLPKRNLFFKNSFTYLALRITRRVTIFILTAVVIESVAIPAIYFHKLFIIYIILIYTGQLLIYFLMHIFMKYRRQKGFNTSRAIIIGVNKTARLLKTMIENSPSVGCRFIGYISSKHSNDPNVLGPPGDLEQLIDEYHGEIVFVTHSVFKNENRGKEFLRICNKKGIRLRYVTENKPWMKSRINAESYENLVFLNPQYIPLDDSGLRLLKRIFDIVFSLAAILLIFWWLFPLIALAIKINSRGPVFFLQERTGINNKIFRCIKFRSMRMNEEANLKQATQKDERVTLVGAFLRQTHMDELPQFFNVLAGHMSVVGPRPHMLKHTQYYSDLIKYYLTRHYVKPGVSGWAQVNGYHGETNELRLMQKRVEYDMEYIERWTLGWDLKIIWLTVFGKDSFNLREPETPAIAQDHGK